MMMEIDVNTAPTRPSARPKPVTSTDRIGHVHGAPVRFGRGYFSVKVGAKQRGSVIREDGSILAARWLCCFVHLVLMQRYLQHFLTTGASWTFQIDPRYLAGWPGYGDLLGEEVDDSDKLPWEKSDAKQPDEYTWEEFEMLTPELKELFFEWFETPADYENWMNFVKSQKSDYKNIVE